jgi:hypothetical protein
VPCRASHRLHHNGRHPSPPSRSIVGPSGHPAESPECDPDAGGEDEEREERGEVRAREQPAAPAERREPRGEFDDLHGTGEGPERGQEDEAQDSEAGAELAGEREEGDEEERDRRERGEDEAEEGRRHGAERGEEPNLAAEEPGVRAGGGGGERSEVEERGDEAQDREGRLHGAPPRIRKRGLDGDGGRGGGGGAGGGEERGRDGEEEEDHEREQEQRREREEVAGVCGDEAAGGRGRAGEDVRPGEGGWVRHGPRDRWRRGGWREHGRWRRRVHGAEVTCTELPAAGD